MIPVELRIIEWNRKRNHLAFNPKLEIQMLSEEAREFYTAETLADRVRECADFMFVFVGCKAKFNAIQYLDVCGFMQSWEGWEKLEAWANHQLNDMLTQVRAEMECDQRQVMDVMNEVLEIVTAANEAKTAEKNEQGKVVKGADYVDPIERIKALL